MPCHGRLETVLEHGLAGLPRRAVHAPFRTIKSPWNPPKSALRCSRDSQPIKTPTTADAAAKPSIPWQISHYYTKKSRRITDATGEISQDPDHMLQPIGWNPDAKLHLAIQAVARESGLSEAEVYLQLETMVNVVPDLLATGGMKLAEMVRLAVNGEQVAEKLLALKGAFPEADVSSIAARCPQLLDMSLQELTLSAQQARAMLGSTTPNPGAVVQAAPLLASAAVLQAVVHELQRLFGRDEGEVLKMLCQNPALADCCQTLAHQARGDRDPEYVQEMFVKSQRT